MKPSNEININKEQNYAEIIVNSKKYGMKKIKIDIKDIEKVKDKRVFISNEGYKTDTFYAEMYLKDRSNKKVRLHRYLTDCPKNLVVDHINFDTLDNRKSNLMICSSKHNCSKKDVLKTHSNTDLKHITKLKNIYRITFYKGASKTGCKRVFDKYAKTLEEALKIRDEYIKRSGKYATNI